MKTIVPMEAPLMTHDTVVKPHLTSLPRGDSPSHNTMNETTTLNTIVLCRSLLNDLPLICFSVAFCVFIIGCSILLKDPLADVVGQNTLLVLSRSMVAISLLVCIVIIFRRFNVKYLIADDGVKALRGILSNSQVDAKLDYYQIRGTEIHRSLFERIIGTGDLLVRGSTGTEIEVSFKGIYNPYLYQKLIQERHRREIQRINAANALL